MKYRKKPVVIDAIQWNGKNHREMFDFLTNYELTNEFMSTSGENFYIDHDKIKGGLIIKTLEGEHLASIGDYIIKGVKGEFWSVMTAKWCFLSLFSKENRAKIYLKSEVVSIVSPDFEITIKSVSSYFIRNKSF